MSDKGRLAGKKAIITGSGTGIGREIALEFARQGADVVLHYAHSSAGAKSAVKEIEDMGRKATAYAADFSKVEEVIDFGNKAIKFLDGIDCLVNNAGITFNMPIRKVSVDQFEWMYNVNIKAQYFLCQRVIEELTKKNKPGQIVNITSIHGVSGAPEHSVYAGTKGAIIAFTRSLAMEVGHKGIRVNALAPGCVPVENYNKVVKDFNLEDAKKWAANAIPVGHFGTPLDIARVAVFLCTDDSRYILGQTIIVDGGTTNLMSLISDFRNESTAHFGTGYLPGV